MTNNDVPTVLEEGAELPTYGSEEAAGADIRANIIEEVVLNPGERRRIPTGLRLEIPKGFEIQVRSRSGLACKHGVTVLNSPGTIDSDYRGEIEVILINHGEKDFVITPKMRIAQFVFAPVIQACYREEECLKATGRGEGGFGHTGTH
ncbi:MAG: dUTP diphosphatase [Simkaniaceae bacterium]|nr:dUTP diphosphatase [Simkaniaceae bacterium]